MTEYLIFTCPECESHELLRADRTMAYRKDRSVLHKEGKYLPGESELIELEPRGLAGLRCAQCGFPDTKKSTTFEWKKWKDVASNGCLSPDPDYGKEEVACTVCSLDGRFYRTSVMLQRGETLSPEHRRQLLEHVLNGQPGVVLCERDPVEEVPDVAVDEQ